MRSPPVNNMSSASITQSDSDSTTIKADMVQAKETTGDPATSPHIQKINRPNVSFVHECCLVLLLCSTQLLVQAGLGQAIVPLHVIGDSFGVSNPGQLSWFAAAYSLTVGTFILISGRFGDIFGHRKIFIIGFFWYGLWSVIAGVSVYADEILFDVCRALQGIGSALLLPNAIAILGRTYPAGPRKDMVFSLFGSTAPAGFVVGAVFSSLFAQLLWWPWAYWALGITCSILGCASCWILPVDVGFTERSKLWQRLDIPGSICGVTGLVLFNFAWNQGPVVGWPTPYTYALLIVGTAFIVVFFVVEHYSAYPLLPIKQLSRNSLFVFGCVAAGWSSFGIWIYYLFQFLELERRNTILLSSAQFIPAAISGLCAAITTGFLVSRIPPGVLMLISMTAFTVGIILVATAPVNQAYWAQTFVSTIVMPWGMDISFPAAIIILSNSMDAESQGLAASLVNTVVNYSISIGLGFAGTVEGQVNNGGVDLLKGYRGAWYMGIGLGSLGMMVSLLFILSSTLSKRSRISAC